MVFMNILFQRVEITRKSHTRWRMQYKKGGSKPFLFNKAIVFTYGEEFFFFFFCFWRDKIPIHIYSFLKAIPLLATFLIKAKTSFKYSLYLIALLLIKEAFTHNLFVFQATLSINLFVCSIL